MWSFHWISNLCLSYLFNSKSYVKKSVTENSWDLKEQFFKSIFISHPCFNMLAYNQCPLRETFRNKTLTFPPLHGHSDHPALTNTHTRGPHRPQVILYIKPALWVNTVAAGIKMSDSIIIALFNAHIHRGLTAHTEWLLSLLRSRLKVRGLTFMHRDVCEIAFVQMTVLMAW